MGRDDNFSLRGFLLGAVVGSMASTAIFYYWLNFHLCHVNPSEEQDELSGRHTNESCDEEKKEENPSNRSGVCKIPSSQVQIHTIKDVEVPLSYHNRGTNCQVITEDDWAVDDELIQRAEAFEELLSKIKTEEEMETALRRSRAVNALAQALAGAEDEKACFEVVSRLIVPLFGIDGCCYALMKDSETVVFNHLTSNCVKYLERIGLKLDENGSVEQPFHTTAAAACSETLEQIYVPRTAESPYPAHRLTYKAGLNSILVTPIVVYGNRFLGCILAYMECEDGFSETDRVLIKDLAAVLSASIYNMRLKLASECSNKIAKEMLHSMIPPKVIEKIECFWDETSNEYKSRRSSSFIDSKFNSINESDRSNERDEFLSLLENAISIADASNPQQPTTERIRQRHRQSISNKINLLNGINKSDSDVDDQGMALGTSAMELETTQKALYADTVPNVCIIFTDIVGFSNITHQMKAIGVMDVLQALFTRFDTLCDRYGIQKLETIGDMFICTTNMFDNDSTESTTQSAANALALAKDMIKEAKKVFVSKNSKQTLEIRVGIHKGDLTCGVLGERLPKFTVFGSSVNLAARMKQTCPPSRIRVTKAFCEMLPDEHWQEKEVISVKNMGEVETYLLNPNE